jgi:hypothetical protein
VGLARRLDQDWASHSGLTRTHGYFGTVLTGGELTTGAGARIAAIDFDMWLVTEGQGVER